MRGFGYNEGGMNTVFFTRKGDSGKSGFGAKTIKKDDALFDALGALDSVNSFLGWCAVEAQQRAKKKRSIIVIHRELSVLQEMLFIAQAEVAAIGFGMKGARTINAGTIEQMESMILGIDTKLPAMKKFVLPGGSELAARLDIARAVSRDAERALLRFNAKKKCSSELLMFANRLSSVLFAFARFANFELHVKEKNPSYK